MNETAARRWTRRAVECLLTLLLLEGGTRVLLYARDGTTVRDKSYDAELGWNATPSYVPKVRRLRDFQGVQYERRYRTDERGSRLWGTHPGQPKVLFLGDSYTQAFEVSNDTSYYAKFAQLSGLDTYELGVGGYGTLQERLLLARTLRASGVHPDIFVLQFCSNDWINNSAELEGEWIFLDQRVRPYRALDGRIFRTRVAHPIVLTVLRYSRFASSGLHAAEVLFQKLTGRFRFDRISASRRPAAEREASATTSAELRELKALMPSAHLYAFNCDESEEGFGAFRQNQEFLRIAAENGFTPLPGVMRYVEDTGGRNVRSADGGHLNDEGHRRLAEFLYRQICSREPCAH